MNKIYYICLALCFVTSLMVAIPPALSQTAPSESSMHEKMELQPPLTKKEVRAWLSLVANDVFNFSPLTFEDKRMLNRKYFTRSGFKSFYAALEEASIPKIIREKNQTVRGFVVSPLQVSDAIIKGQLYQWSATFEYALEYSNKNAVTVQFLNVGVEIIEKPTDDLAAPLPHIGIETWYASPSTSPSKVVCTSESGPDAKTLLKLKHENALLKEKIAILTAKEEDSKKPPTPTPSSNPPSSVSPAPASPPLALESKPASE